MVVRNARLSNSDISFEYQVASMGGWLDAYTTYDRTVFDLTVLPEWAPQAADLLRQLIGTLEFDEVDWFLERKVIQTQMYESLSQYDADYYLRCMLWGRSSKLVRPIIGTPPALERVTPSDIMRFWKRHYLLDRCFWLWVGAIPNGIEPFRLTNAINNSLYICGESISRTQPNGPAIRFVDRKRWNMFELDINFIFYKEIIHSSILFFYINIIAKIVESKLLLHLRHYEGLVSDITVSIEQYPFRIRISTSGSSGKAALTCKRLFEVLHGVFPFNKNDVLFGAWIRKRELLEAYHDPYKFKQHLLSPGGIHWSEEVSLVQNDLETVEGGVGQVNELGQQILRRNNLYGIVAGNVSQNEKQQISQIVIEYNDQTNRDDPRTT